MDSSKITTDDFDKIMEYINKCMYAYKFWNAKYTKIINDIKEGKNYFEIDKLQKNYDAVMNALVVCFKFIQDCDHVLKDYKDTLIFGVIYVSMKDVHTDNIELIKQIEIYKKWFETRD
jgi:hypothetical protein